MRVSITSRAVAQGVWAAVIVLVGACAPATPRSPHPVNGLVVADPDVAKSLGAPRVAISTEYEYGAFRQVRTRLRVEDDAYVLVVNVLPDGSAHILFPESSGDSGLLRGSQSYLLPRFFGGYPSMALEHSTSTTQFVRVGRSAFTSARIRGPGYTFVLASRTPFDMQRLEDEGFFDWTEMGNSLFDLGPDEVIPVVAELALGAQGNFVAMTDVARYAGYDTFGVSPYRYASAFSAYSGLGGGLCSPASLLEWPYMTTRPVPSACLDAPRMLFGRVAPRPVAPPQDSTAEADSATAPRDTSSAAAPKKPTLLSRTSIVESELETRNVDAIELDRHTRATMLRRDALEARHLGGESRMRGSAGGLRRGRPGSGSSDEARPRSRMSDIERTRPQSRDAEGSRRSPQGEDGLRRPVSRPEPRPESRQPSPREERPTSSAPSGGSAGASSTPARERPQPTPIPRDPS